MRQSVDYREKEAQAMATKRQSADYRKREAQGKATKRQSCEYKEGKLKRRSNVVSNRNLLPATSCKLLKPSLQLLKKGQITHVSAAIA